jgi:hypothetical protein
MGSHVGLCENTISVGSFQSELIVASYLTKAASKSYARRRPSGQYFMDACRDLMR